MVVVFIICLMFLIDELIVEKVMNLVLVFWVMILVRVVFFIFGGFYKIRDGNWFCLISLFKIFFVLISWFWLKNFVNFLGCIWLVKGVVLF